MVETVMAVLLTGLFVVVVVQALLTVVTSRPERSDVGARVEVVAEPIVVRPAPRMPAPGPSRPSGVAVVGVAAATALVVALVVAGARRRTG